MKTNTKADSQRRFAAVVVGLLFVGLLTAGISAITSQKFFRHSVQAQAEVDKPASTQLQKQFNCSNAILQGGYAVTGSGFAPNGSPSSPLVPFTNLSLMTMDGAGKLSNKITVSRNGQIVRNVDSGVYTVNSDCTGTMMISIPTPPFKLNFDLVVADLQNASQGKEFYFISTTPGGVVTHTAKRIQ